MRTLIHNRVKECRDGSNPKTICRVPSGWFVIGDVQFLHGYSLLLPDPVVPTLNDLPNHLRSQFLSDMTLLGDAILACTDAFRINYEILGNSEPALHAHVFPRYGNEPPELRSKPAWFYDWENAPQFDPDRDSALMEEMHRYVAKARVDA